jgi:hypothetical protein
MKKVKKNNRMDFINNEASNLVEQWLVLMSHQQLDLANILCSTFIEKNKKILKNFFIKILKMITINYIYYLFCLSVCRIILNYVK